MQDVPGMLERKGLAPCCYFDPDAPANRAHFVRLNYEAFFFCSAAELERFGDDPTRYCGFLTDPVSKQRFRPRPDSPSAEHEGTRFFFQGSATLTAFRAEPNAFVLPGWKMPPLPAEEGASARASG